jgi:hypothetical protein
MGQARQRGTQAERTESAQARLEAIKPAAIICNKCKARITDVQILDSKGMPGIEAIFAGECECGDTTIAMKGEPAAVVKAMEAFQDSTGEDIILGTQPT